MGDYKAPVILLRGLNRDSRYWLEFVEQLEHATGHQVIPLELPGMGVNGNGKAKLTVGGNIEDLRTSLAEQGIDGPIHVVGLSLGGMVGLEWLKRHPEQILTCTSVNSSGMSYIFPFTGRVNFWSWFILGIRIPLYQLKNRTYGLPVDFVYPYLVDGTSEKRKVKLLEQWKELDNQYATRNITSFRQIFSVLLWTPKGNLCKPLDQGGLGARVLIINGTKDRFVPKRSSMRLHRWLKGSKMVCFPGGHELLMSHGEESAKSISQHILNH